MFMLPASTSIIALGLFDSEGAWTKLRSDQRCKIKCFRHVFYISAVMEGAVGRLQAHISRRQKTESWHINRRFISQERGTWMEQPGYATREITVQRRKIDALEFNVVQETIRLECFCKVSRALSSCRPTRSSTSDLHTVIPSLVFLICSFTFFRNPTSHHFTLRPLSTMLSWQVLM